MSSTPPVVYNWSLGVQRDIGWQLVADIAYVGNAARNQRIDRADQRPACTATRIRPSSLDPTNVSAGMRSRCPTTSCGPTSGYGSHHPARLHAGTRDYHSLQFSVNRRRTADGLSFGVAYTYQSSNKTLEAIDPFVSGQPGEKLHAR